MVTILSSKLIIKKGNNLLFKSFYSVYNTHLNWQNCPMTDKTRDLSCKEVKVFIKLEERSTMVKQGGLH